MIIIIGTIFSIGSFSYIYLSKVTENEINSYSDIIIDQISQSFEDSFSGVDSIINLVYNYQVLKDVMEKDIPTSDFERLTLAHQVSDAMLNIAMLRKDIEAITVFCKYFFPKVAKYFSIVLQQEFPQCCKPYFAKLLVHCRQ